MYCLCCGKIVKETSPCELSARPPRNEPRNRSQSTKVARNVKSGGKELYMHFKEQLKNWEPLPGYDDASWEAWKQPTLIILFRLMEHVRIVSMEWGNKQGGQWNPSTSYVKRMRVLLPWEFLTIYVNVVSATDPKPPHTLKKKGTFFFSKEFVQNPSNITIHRDDDAGYLVYYSPPRGAVEYQIDENQLQAIVMADDSLGLDKSTWTFLTTATLWKNLHLKAFKWGNDAALGSDKRQPPGAWKLALTGTDQWAFGRKVQ